MKIFLEKNKLLSLVLTLLFLWSSISSFAQTNPREITLTVTDVSVGPVPGNCDPGGFVVSASDDDFYWSFEDGLGGDISDQCIGNDNQNAPYNFNPSEILIDNEPYTCNPGGNVNFTFYGAEADGLDGCLADILTTSDGSAAISIPYPTDPFPSNGPIPAVSQCININDGDCGTVEMCFTAEWTFSGDFVPPGEDNICNAIMLPWNNTASIGSMTSIENSWCLDQTIEPGEPTSNLGAAHGSYWYMFTVPAGATGSIRLTTAQNPDGDNIESDVTDGSLFGGGTEFAIYHSAIGEGCPETITQCGVEVPDPNPLLFDHLSFIDDADLGGTLNTGFNADLDLECAGVFGGLGAGLIPGETYYVQVSADDQDALGVIEIAVGDLGNAGAGGNPIDIPCQAFNANSFVDGTVNEDGITAAEFAMNTSCAFDNEMIGNPPVYDVTEDGGANTLEESTVWFFFTATNSGQISIDVNCFLQGEATALFGYDPAYAPGTPFDLSCAHLINMPNGPYGNGYGSGGSLGGEIAEIDYRCLEPGYDYYVVTDEPLIAACDPDVWIYDPDPSALNPPGNDVLCLTGTAYDIPVNPIGSEGAANGCGDNTNACIESLAGEPTLTGDNLTTWHTFTAPPSGAVNIQIDSGHEFALYPTLDGTAAGCYGGLAPATYTVDGTQSTACLVACASGVMDEACCLIPGDTYYLQVDGPAGAYCIIIDELEVHAGNTSYVHGTDGDNLDETTPSPTTAPEPGILCFGEGLTAASDAVAGTDYPSCMQQGFIIHNTDDPNAADIDIQQADLALVTIYDVIDPALNGNILHNGALGAPTCQVVYVSALVDGTNPIPVDVQCDEAFGDICGSVDVHDAVPVVFLEPITPVITVPAACPAPNEITITGGLPCFDGSEYDYSVSTAAGQTVLDSGGNPLGGTTTGGSGTTIMIPSDDDTPLILTVTDGEGCSTTLVIPPDPLCPPLDICDLIANEDITTLGCSPAGNLTIDVVVTGVTGGPLSVVGAIGVTPAPAGDGTYTVEVAPNAMTTVTFSDPTQAAGCAIDIELDFTGITCIDGVPTCVDPPTVQVDYSTLQCDAGTNDVTFDVIITGANTYEVDINGTITAGVTAGTATYTAVGAANTAIIITVTDETVIPEVACEADTTIPAVATSTCPDPPGSLCDFDIILDYSTIVCNGDGTITASLVIDNDLDMDGVPSGSGVYDITVNGVVTTGLAAGTTSITFPAGAALTISAVDANFVATPCAALSTISIPADQLTCPDPPAAECNFDIILDYSTIVCTNGDTEITATLIIDNDLDADGIPSGSGVYNIDVNGTVTTGAAGANTITIPAGAAVTITVTDANFIATPCAANNTITLTADQTTCPDPPAAECNFDIILDYSTITCTNGDTEITVDLIIDNDLDMDGIPSGSGVYNIDVNGTVTAGATGVNTITIPAGAAVTITVTDANFIATPCAANNTITLTADQTTCPDPPAAECNFNIILDYSTIVCTNGDTEITVDLIIDNDLDADGIPSGSGVYNIDVNGTVTAGVSGANTITIPAGAAVTITVTDANFIAIPCAANNTITLTADQITCPDPPAAECNFDITLDYSTIVCTNGDTEITATLIIDNDLDMDGIPSGSGVYNIDVNGTVTAGVSGANTITIPAGAAVTISVTDANFIATPCVANNTITLTADQTTCPDPPAAECNFDIILDYSTIVCTNGDTEITATLIIDNDLDADGVPSGSSVYNIDVNGTVTAGVSGVNTITIPAGAAVTITVTDANFIATPCAANNTIILTADQTVCPDPPAAECNFDIQLDYSTIVCDGANTTITATLIIDNDLDMDGIPSGSSVYDIDVNGTITPGVTGANTITIPAGAAVTITVTDANFIATPCAANNTITLTADQTVCPDPPAGECNFDIQLDYSTITCTNGDTEITATLIIDNDIDGDGVPSGSSVYNIDVNGTVTAGVSGANTITIPAGAAVTITVTDANFIATPCAALTTITLSADQLTCPNPPAAICDFDIALDYSSLVCSGSTVTGTLIITPSQVGGVDTGSGVYSIDVNGTITMGVTGSNTISLPEGTAVTIIVSDANFIATPCLANSQVELTENQLTCSGGPVPDGGDCANLGGGPDVGSVITVGEPICSIDALTFSIEITVEANSQFDAIFADIAGNSDVGSTTIAPGSTVVFTFPANMVYDFDVTDANFIGTPCTVNFTDQIFCCLAEAGDILGDPICPEEDLELTIDGYEDFNLYNTYVIITDPIGTILDIIPVEVPGTDVTFPGSLSSTTATIPYANWAGYLGAGISYDIYAYSELTINPPSPQPIIGANINDIGTGPDPADAVCFDLSDPPLSYFVPDLLTIDCDVQTSEGANGGVTPFYYNTHEICVSGGTLPYAYNWSTVGYVRQAIIGTGEVRIHYADNAIWALTVTDANGCSNNTWEFTNDPGTVGGTGEILDIYDSNVTSTSNCFNNDGSIEIFVEGGAGNYTYEWNGPFTWDGTGQGTNVISNLVRGWYAVTVTDDVGDTTLGWYWVQCRSASGRGKLTVSDFENGIGMIAYPNPVSLLTNIEFSVVSTERVELSIISLDGKVIANLFEGTANEGEVYNQTFKASTVTPGVYLVRLLTESGKVQNQKLIVTD